MMTVVGQERTCIHPDCVVRIVVLRLQNKEKQTYREVDVFNVAVYHNASTVETLDLAVPEVFSTGCSRTML
jgi:hypothetical protein